MNDQGLLKKWDRKGLYPAAPSRTLSDHIADRIVEAIAARQIVSGQRLIETELAEAMHVSRVPVRAALQSLESQGIATAAPRRGLQAGSFDDAWARQLRDTRIALERLAAPLAAARISQDPLLAMRLESEIALLAVAQDDWLAVNKADIAFHTAIFDLAQSPLLLTLWQAIARHVLILFSIESDENPNFETVLDDHRAYLDHLRAGQEEQMHCFIAKHITARRAS